MILWVSVEAVTLFYCQIYRTDKHSNPTVLNRFVQLLFAQLLPRTRTEEINTIKTNMLSPTGPPISGHDTCRCRGQASWRALACHRIHPDWLRKLSETRKRPQAGTLFIKTLFGIHLNKCAVSLSLWLRNMSINNIVPICFNSREDSLGILKASGIFHRRRHRCTI